MFAQFAALSLLVLVAAQDSSSGNASSTDIAIVEANFESKLARIVFDFEALISYHSRC